MNYFIKATFTLLFFSFSFITNSQQTLVEVDKIIESNLNQTVPFIGTVVSNKDTVLMAPLPGTVDRIFFKEGDLITKGKLISKIDYKKYKLVYEKAKESVKIHEAEYNNSKIETTLNLLDLNRMETLKKSSAFNESKFDKLKYLNEINKSNEIKALANLETSKHNLNLALLDLKKSEIRALYDGVLEEQFVEKGEVVAVGAKMFNLVSKKDLEILVEIPTLRANNINIKNKVTAITVDDLKILATVRAIGAKENAKTRTVKVFLTFSNLNQSRNLFSGENITLQIPIGEGKKALTIHKDAILKREGISLAYVVKENKVQIRPLKLGEAVDNRFIIYSGVSVNELVVIKGNERLRPGQEVDYKNVD
ncbi:MAG: Efflux pump periplasmic linker BepF [Alphaproteobacteria bacterium MarineAlpha9_Bin4]|nr:hypothetical protein [Pelagibacterales bacterium]PPR25876.1 MAG: Efflux pump periplasmic linker BepF [Alphaproteobacteria bacterium MarineAlpha9_Bin4]|tara:strand:+ start:124 stop:1218 length:1095 start_codon:yes stop_codon:yes gene_type:complete